MTFFLVDPATKNMNYGYLYILHFFERQYHPDSSVNQQLSRLRQASRGFHDLLANYTPKDIRDEKQRLLVDKEVEDLYLYEVFYWYEFEHRMMFGYVPKPQETEVFHTGLAGRMLQNDLDFLQDLDMLLIGKMEDECKKFLVKREDYLISHILANLHEKRFSQREESDLETYMKRKPEEKNTTTNKKRKLSV